jgi:hypothetical protein
MGRNCLSLHGAALTVPLYVRRLYTRRGVRGTVERVAFNAWEERRQIAMVPRHSWWVWQDRQAEEGCWVQGARLTSIMHAQCSL